MTIIAGAKRMAASGKSERQSLIRPYPPRFSSRLPTNTRVTGDACCCVAGYQRWSGKMAPVIPQATAAAQNIQACANCGSPALTGPARPDLDAAVDTPNVMANRATATSAAAGTNCAAA